MDQGLKTTTTNVSANVSDSYAEFMAGIREVCRLMGIRQKDLADSLDLKPSQMNLYYQGKVEMRVDRFLAILNILGISVEEQINQKIKELGGDTRLNETPESKVLATLGRLDENKKKSLLRIINTLGEK